MAIYTRQNIGVLSNIPLDNRSVTSNDYWSDEYNSYLGQLVYNSNDGWFTVHSASNDDETVWERNIFAASTDGIYVGSPYLQVAHLGTSAELQIRSVDSPSHTIIGYNFISISDYGGAQTQLSDNHLTIAANTDPTLDISSTYIYLDADCISNNDIKLDGDVDLFVGKDMSHLYKSPNNTADANKKHAYVLGEGLKTNTITKQNALIIGRYNSNDVGGSAFVIGNGTDDSHRSNLAYISELESYIPKLRTEDYTHIDELSRTYSISPVNIKVNSPAWVFDSSTISYGPGVYTSDYTTIEMNIEGGSKETAYCHFQAPIFPCFLRRGLYSKIMIKKSFSSLDPAETLTIRVIPESYIAPSHYNDAHTHAIYLIENFPIGKMSIGDIAIENICTYVGSDCAIEFKYNYPNGLTSEFIDIHDAMREYDEIYITCEPCVDMSF